MLTDQSTSPDHRAVWLLVAKHLGESAMWLGIGSVLMVLVPFVIGAAVHGPSALFGAFAFACFGGGVALGILAVVVAIKARRIGRTNPAMAGLVTGIVGISCNGLVLFTLLMAGLAAVTD